MHLEFEYFFLQVGKNIFNMALLVCSCSFPLEFVICPEIKQLHPTCFVWRVLLVIGLYILQ
jgi:hypothetical protein